MTIGSKAELSAQLVLEIVVSKLNNSLVFYKALGFELERRSENFAVLRWHTRYIFLLEDKERRPLNASVANVRVLVENIDVVWERAGKLHADIESPPNVQPYGIRDFTILDPDGFGIRFAEILPSAQVKEE